MSRCALIAICFLVVGALGSRLPLHAPAHALGGHANHTSMQMTAEQVALLLGTWTVKLPTQKFFSVDIADKVLANQITTSGQANATELLKATQDLRNLALIFPASASGAPKMDHHLEFVVWDAWVLPRRRDLVRASWSCGMAATAQSWQSRILWAGWSTAC